MKKIVLVLSLLFCSSGGFAQLAGQPPNYTSNAGAGAYSEALYQYARGSIDESNSKSNLLNESIEGSPYLSNNFAATTLFYDKENQGTIYYRYNAYNEEVEIKQQNLGAEPIVGLSKDKKINIIINNKPMSFKTFIDKKMNTKNGYLTLLRGGKYKLYHHLKVTFRDAKKPANSFEKGRPAKFSQFDEYYLENESGKKISQVEFNNKKVIALIPDNHKETAQQFLKSKKLKIKTVNDLYQVIDFLNDLK
jgi:hypothetical protein